MKSRRVRRGGMAMLWQQDRIPVDPFGRGVGAAEFAGGRSRKVHGGRERDFVAIFGRGGVGAAELAGGRSRKVHGGMVMLQQQDGMPDAASAGFVPHGGAGIFSVRGRGGGGNSAYYRGQMGGRKRTCRSKSRCGGRPWEYNWVHHGTK